MKKLVTAAVIIGVVTFPSVALARHGADDTSEVSSTSNSQTADDSDNRAADDRGRGRGADDANDANETMVTIAGQTEQVKVQNDVDLPEGSKTIDEAVAIAKDKMPGKTVSKVEVETEDDVTVISVRFTDKSRVDVRASDGVVTRERTRNEADKQNNNDADEDEAADADEDEDDNDESDSSSKSGSGSGNSGSGNSGRGNKED